MIIRKITEVTETQTTETFQLICDEKDEGWELTREEMEKLRTMTERSLEDFYGRREKETVPAELYDDLYRKYNLACFQSDEAKGKFYEDLTEEAKCRVCGCTWNNACQGGCYWVEEDLCSACAEKADDEKECPDYIEPPAPEVVCENGVCHLVLPEEEEMPEPAAEVTESSENLTKTEEKEQEPERKVKKRELRDFSKYVKMLQNGDSNRKIIIQMTTDMGITASTANVYFYDKVKPLLDEKEEQEQLREIEDEKKQLEKKLDKKIQVIPASEPDNPRKRRSFTEEEKERIRRAAGVSIK